MTQVHAGCVLGKREALLTGINASHDTETRCVCRAGALSREASGAAGTDLQRWEVDPKHVILGERLAVGGFAEVFVGQYEVRRRRFAPAVARVVVEATLMSWACNFFFQGLQASSALHAQGSVPLCAVLRHCQFQSGLVER